MTKEKSGRLLVVDDEIETLTPLCDLLSEWGYEVMRCTSGKEALEASKKQQFDVMLADLVMPEMDGIELIKKAIKIAPILVCIIITGKGTIQSAVEAMKIGAFDYVLKPIEWKMLRPIIFRAMETRRLRESEKKYRAIVEDQTELISRWKPGEILTFVNEAFCRYFNKQPEELIGHSFMPLIPEEDHKKVRQHFASLTQENPVSTHEHKVFCSDGEIRWQQWANRAIFDSQGNIIEYQSAGRDITERRKMEEALKEEQFKLREYFENLPVPAYNITYDGKIADCNNVSVSTLDYDNKDELIGKPLISKVYAPSSQEKAKQLFEKWKRWGTLKNEELQIITKQGVIKDVLLNVDTIYDLKGNPLYSISTHLDITDRKRKDEAIVKREKKIRTIADNVPAAVSYVDTDGFYRFVNKRYEEWFGVPQREIIDMHYRELLGDATYYVIKERVEAALSGKRVHYESILPYERGGTRWVMVDYVPDIDAQGKVNGFFALLIDITECKRAEEKLQFLSSMAEQSLDSIISTDTDFRITYMNKSTENMYGWSLDELREKTPDILNAEPNADEIQKQIYTAVSSGNTYSGEILNRRKDGSTFYCQFRISPLINKNGEIYGYMGSQRDVTDRVKAMEALQKSDEKYRDLYDNAPDMYHTLDENGVIIDCNVTEARMLGYKKEEIIGKPVAYFFTEESKRLFESDFPKLKEKKKLLNLEREFIRKDGSTFLTILNVFAEYDNNGKFTGTRAIARDITQLKLAEWALKEETLRRKILMDKSRDGIAIINQEHRVIEANPRFAEMLGYTLEEVIGLHTWDWEAVLTEEEIRTSFSDLTQTSITFETKHRRKDGTVCDVEVSTSGAKVGNKSMVFTISRDITERKRAEEKLRESEERYRAIFEQAADSIVIIDTKTGVLLDFNDKAYQNLGYTYEEFEKLKIHDFDVIESAEEVSKHIEKVIKKGSDTFETKHSTKGRRIRDIHVNSRAISLGGKEFIQSIWRDITELKQVEGKLRKSEERYRTLVESLADVIFNLSFEDSTITSLNPAFEKITGWSRDEWLGRPFMPIIHQDDLPLATTMLQKILSEERILPFELRILSKSGKYLVGEFTGTPQIENGKVVGMYGIARDITDRKQAEEELVKSEERLRTLSDAAFEGIVFHKKGILLRANDQFFRIFGYKPDELIGKDILQLLTAPEAQAFMKKQIAGGKLGPYESIGVRKDGTKFPIEIRARETELEGEKIRIATVMDITERKIAEDELRKSHEQLRALTSRLSEVEEAERRRLAQELHDQVGQNLTALGININTLPTLVSPGEAEKIKSRVRDTQKLLDETTQSIRSVMADLRPSVLDDYGLLSALRWYTEKFSERIGIPVKIAGRPLKKRLSEFLETTLYRITQEALTNIAKHSRASKVKICLGESKTKVKLTIADNGKGFMPETVYKRKKKTVWGLLTMKERAEAIGGKFDVQSSHRKGTKIVVEIKRN